MNIALQDALQYIQNADGKVTLDDFLVEYEPNGPALWDQLCTQRLVYIDSDQVLRVTQGGEAALMSALAPGAPRSSTAARSSSTDNSLDLTNPLNPLSPFSPLSPTFDTASQPSADHCSIHSNSTDFGSSSSSSDSSCSYSSDSSSSSSSYD
jgi:hypothetical protein